MAMDKRVGESKFKTGAQEKGLRAMFVKIVIRTSYLSLCGLA
jgi:hypothetical protein